MERNGDGQSNHITPKIVIQQNTQIAACPGDNITELCPAW